MDRMDNNGWNEWSKYVLKELERLDLTMKDISKNMEENNRVLAQLQVKAGVWGAIGGAIPVSIAILLWIVKGKPF